MGIINVAEIGPEMVLAEDVRCRNGRFLIGKGTKLTPKHLRILKIWGVFEANVAGVSGEMVELEQESKRDQAHMEEIERIVRERFLLTDIDHPAIKEMVRICTHRQADQFDESQKNEQVKSKYITEPHDECMDLKEGDLPKMDPVKLIQRDIILPTLPNIFVQINEVIKKPNSSANDIARVISKDTTLSARLLKIVNSPFYGFPSKVDTLSRAVAIIGTKQLSTLAMGINVINIFKNIPDDLMDMKSFWHHSIACGINARSLGTYKNVRNTERLFVAGLLHDIGRLVLYNYTPFHARSALLMSRRDQCSLQEAEIKTLGFDHAKIGELLLTKWKLPISLENIVKYHHSPMEAQLPLEPALVHLADIVSSAAGMGTSGEFLVPNLENEAWDLIGLSPNVLGSVVEQMDRQVEEVFEFIYGDER